MIISESLTQNGGSTHVHLILLQFDLPPDLFSFSFFLLLVLSAYRICLFSHLSLLFFVSFGLVTHVVLAFFHFRHFSFFFHLDFSLVVHAFMRRYFSVRSRVSILLMRPCAAIFLSVLVSDDCWLQIDCWWPDCMPRWWWLIAWWNDILTNWLPFHRPTLLRKTTGVQNVVLTPKNFIMYIFATITAARICWRTVFVEIL